MYGDQCEIERALKCIFSKYPTASLASPMYASRPSVRSIRLSSIVYIELRGWWIVHTTHRPCIARSLSDDMTFCAWNESSPLVGSSRKIALGSRTISTPMLHRFLSPPDSPRGNPPTRPTGESATFFSPSSEIRNAAVLRFLSTDADGGSRSLACN